MDEEKIPTCSNSALTMPLLTKSYFIGGEELLSIKCVDWILKLFILYQQNFVYCIKIWVIDERIRKKNI